MKLNETLTLFVLSMSDRRTKCHCRNLRGKWSQVMLIVDPRLYSIKKLSCKIREPYTVVWLCTDLLKFQVRDCKIYFGRLLCDLIETRHGSQRVGHDWSDLACMHAYIKHHDKNPIHGYFYYHFEDKSWNLWYFKRHKLRMPIWKRRFLHYSYLTECPGHNY